MLGSGIHSAFWPVRAALVVAVFAGLVALAGCGQAASSAPDASASTPVTRPSSNAGRGCKRPYEDGSVWNTPIAADAKLSDPGRLLYRQGDVLTSDPVQYTTPIFYSSAKTREVVVVYEGWYSRVSNGGRTLHTFRYQGDLERQRISVRIPRNARSGDGVDGNVIVLDPASGTEWDFSEFRWEGRAVHVNNVARYNTAWSGVPPATSVNSGSPYWNNGAGVPLLGGVIRPCEIARGKIDHALSFAYARPTPEFIFPARKSDGTDDVSRGLPEGTLLQLDPAISRDQLSKRGCRAACLTIATAMQRYGMYLLNGSGRSKVFAEGQITAHWGKEFGANTPTAIPLDRVRVVERGYERHR